MEIRELTNDEAKAKQDALDYVIKLSQKDDPFNTREINELYASFVKGQILNEEAIIALGISFGELFRTIGNYEWVRVIDEYGSETCLAVLGKRLTIAPISMIQKRLNEKVDVNIKELLWETHDRVNEVIQSNNYRNR